MVEGLPRFFACARDGGWWVMDEKLRDKHDKPAPLHEDTMTEEDARELVKEMNDG